LGIEDEKPSSQGWAVDSWFRRKSVYQVFFIGVVQDLLRLPELFSPGMLVRCVVSSLDIKERGKKSVKLSLNPKNVNRVLSAEVLKPGMVCIWCQERGMPSLCCISWGVWSRPPFTFSLMTTHTGRSFLEGRSPGCLMNIEDLNIILLPWRGERESKSKFCRWPSQIAPGSLSGAFTDGEKESLSAFSSRLLHEVSLFQGLGIVWNANSCFRSKRQSKQGS
jgi:hypothetical protein